jgi:hypothetical protein
MLHAAYYKTAGLVKEADALQFALSYAAGGRRAEVYSTVFRGD